MPRPLFVMFRATASRFARRAFRHGVGPLACVTAVSATAITVQCASPSTKGSQDSCRMPTDQPTPESIPYDWKIATADNYAWQTIPENTRFAKNERVQVKDGQLDFYGPFAAIRAKLDYTYHPNYTPARQAEQDKIIQAILDSGHSSSKPWVIFTAGAMGAGKGYVMRFLKEQNVINLSAYGLIDPDGIKYELPEMEGYLERDTDSAGSMTHQESGYVQEIAMKAGLQAGLNLWVDGSLRNTKYFKGQFAGIRHSHPEYRIGILHVTAPKEAVVARALARGQKTGRYIPEELLLQALEQVPKSVNELMHFVDYSATVNNQGNGPPSFLGGDHTFEQLTFSMHFRPAASEFAVVDLHPQVKASLIEAFDLLDRDGGGTISRAEGHLMMRAAGQGETRAVQTWNAMLLDADENGDGVISKDEWIEYCSGSPTFQHLTGGCEDCHLQHAVELLEVMKISLRKNMFSSQLEASIEMLPGADGHRWASIALPGGKQRLQFDHSTGAFVMNDIEPS